MGGRRCWLGRAVGAAAVTAVVLALTGCSSGDGSPQPSTTGSGGPPSTAPASTRPPTTAAPTPPDTPPTETRAPSTTVAMADRCAPFAAGVFTAAQAELDRLAEVPLADLTGEQPSAELSDDYYTRVDDAEAGATAAGCPPLELARTVLTGSEGLRTAGPAAVATKAGIVDEMAWRVARTLPKPLDPPALVLPVAGTFSADTAALRTCTDVGRAFLPIHQALIDALAGVALDDYLARPNLRSLDIRDAVSSQPVGGLQFVSATLEAALTALTDRSDELRCQEATLSAVLVAEGDRLRATSPTGIVFKADQIDLALLLVTTG